MLVWLHIIPLSRVHATFSNQGVFTIISFTGKPLKIVSCNVRGIANHAKRRSIFSHYVYSKNQPQPDIYAFQETHLTEDHLFSVRTNLPGKFLISHGTSHARGVLLGFNPRLDVELVDRKLDDQGRYIVAKVLVNKEPLTIVTAYLEPQLSQQKVAEILSKIMDTVNQYENSRVIFCGDFNMVLNDDIDSNTKRGAHKGAFFNKFIDSHDLTDVWRVQHPNTKRYTCFTNNRYLSRLDMFLLSPAMLTHVHNCDIGYSYLSDHSPVTMEFSLTEPDSGRGPWRLPKFLLGVNEWKKQVEEFITEMEQTHQGTDDGILWDTIEGGVRGISIRYLAHTKRVKKEKIENLEAQVANAVQQRDNACHNVDLMQHYANKVNFLQIELDDVFQAENAKLRAYHTARKYFENERSTKYYFHTPGKKYDSIKRLITPQGYVVTDTQEILSMCVKHYSKVYTQSVVSTNDVSLNNLFLRHIPEERMSYKHFQLLEKPISEDELYKALCTMKNDKAPGGSGLTVEFYRTFWPKISRLVHRAITHAFNSGELSPSQRRGLIRLVPKKRVDLMKVNRWRPITLLNVQYKLLTKALALRLKEVLPDLVHSDQKGFIKNRYIGDNIMDIYSIIAKAEENQEEISLLLLDIRAAFDSVSWSFLQKVMDKYMFPDSFMEWIRIIYRKKELRILNNGHVSDPIKPTQGLAQGDGLSPLLFVLTLETLALTIRQNSQISGIHCGDIHKKLALLADDAIVALKHDKISFTALLETLKHFAMVSNLIVNKEKSIIIPVGANTENREVYPGMEEFTIQTKGIFTYLGVGIQPNSTSDIVTRNTLRRENFDYVSPYIDHVIQVRDKPDHTILGRILNTKALIGSKLLYLFSLAPSPGATFHTEIQRKLNDYVWAGKTHGSNAKLMYQPWDTGGMCMYNTKNQEHSLKLKWLNSLLQEGNEFWQVHMRTSFSIPIQQLLKLNCQISDLKRFLKPKARLPLIWQDIFQHWCTYHHCKQQCDPRTELLMGNSNVKTAWITNVKVMLKYQANDIVTIQDFVEKASQLSPQNQKNLHIPIIQEALPTFWKPGFIGPYNVPRWNPDFSQKISVASILKLLLKHHQPTENTVWNNWEAELGLQHLECWWPTITKRRLHLTQIKMRSFYARFINRAYYTNERLFYMGVVPNKNCHFCQSVIETRLHLFWECEKVAPLWKEVINFCKTYVDGNADFCRNNCLLLGFEKPILNLIVTLTKYVIHCSRLFNNSLSFETVLRKILYVRKTEMLAAMILPRLNSAKTQAYWGTLTSDTPFRPIL